MGGSAGFIGAAAAHGKPVIVCESCPIHNGGTENDANWEAWFVPYFAMIESYPHLKAFCYVSDPWDRPGFFDWWDTSLIDVSPYIRDRYAAHLADPCFIHIDEALATVPDRAPLRLAANPMRGKIDFILPEGCSRIEIFDLTGRRCGVVDRRATEIGQAPSGVYLARGSRSDRPVRFVYLRDH